MEVSFDEDINLDEDNSHSNDDCELHNDYDNQKLFDIYESYLNKCDLSDTESEPELSFSDRFHQLVSKSGKTSVNNRSIRKISSFEDIESRTPRKSRKSSLNNECNEFLEESLSELTLPWNLNEMSEQEIIDLSNSLQEELFVKETDGPKTAANQKKDIYEKEIEFLNQMFEESENRLKNCLKKITPVSDQQRIDFNELIGKQLETINCNSEELKKLLFELQVIEDISKK